MTLRDVLRRSDPLLFFAASLLVVLSLVMLSTGTGEEAGKGFFLRQSLSALVALGVVLFAARVHYTYWRGVAPWVYALLVLLLLLVSHVAAIRGAASWLSVGIFRLQPSEIAKVVLVLVLAKVLTNRTEARLDVRTFFLSVAYIGAPVLLVALQPDFGTASLLLFLWFGMISIAGLSWKQCGALVVLGIVVAVLSWTFFLKPYQKARVETFLRPDADPLGSGYTVLQSVTAFGSGGLFGRGLGYGPQSRLNFLPEHRTDFIFARIGEELGLVGVAGVLLLYAIILYRMLATALETSDQFGRAISMGAFFALLVGVFVNAGMNIGLLPVTGVPLPFVSYGGSSLVAMSMLVGLVESVRIHSEKWGGDDDDDIPLPITRGY